MLISDNIVLAVLSRSALCPSLLQSISNFYLDFFSSKNQITNMDNVCKFIESVVFTCF